LTAASLGPRGYEAVGKHDGLHTLTHMAQQWVENRGTLVDQPL
jgi:hypothetical protein